MIINEKSVKLRFFKISKNEHARETRVHTREKDVTKFKHNVGKPLTRSL